MREQREKWGNESLFITPFQAALRAFPVAEDRGRNLLDLGANEKRAVVTTLINKFDTALNVRDFADESADVFLLVGESHRGQYGRLHSRMRKIFPNACYLGFTGTPILNTERNTAAKFGGIIPGTVYSINQAVADKAVVPLLYLARSLKEHNLLQAIARVNRAAEGKEFGYPIRLALQ